MTVLVGLAYPLAVTGVAQVVFPGRADGSLVEQDGNVGRLVADRPVLRRQAGVLPVPSVRGRRRLRPAGLVGSNLGPENEDLIAAIEERRAAAAELDGTDPDRGRARRRAGQRLRPRPAHQPGVRRAAGRPGRPRARPVRGRRARARRPRTPRAACLGFLGEPHVNVLQLNLALDDEPAEQAD